MHIKLIFRIIILLLCCIIPGSSFAQKPNLIVTTDIGQDPDDTQSMIRLLHYSNEFNLLGLIANADSNYDKEPPIIRVDIIHKLIDKYGEVEENLKLHSKEFPSTTYLHSLVKSGCNANGTRIPYHEYIGEDKETEGSQWIIEQVLHSNDLVNISVWGGGADIAQALWDARSELTTSQFAEFKNKLRIYFIGKQDSSVDWIITEFPEIWKIVALDQSGDKWKSGYRGMFLGGDMHITSRNWLLDFVHGENPLASLYPLKAYTGGENGNPYGAMKEGDTPSWFYFLNNGLNNAQHPEYGGWGGRFKKLTKTHYVDAKDYYLNPETGSDEESAMATVYRWRPAFQNDFAARVHWGTKTYGEANHPPMVKIDKVENSKETVIPLKVGAILHLDASDSYDPDGDGIHFNWYFYKEAGTAGSSLPRLRNGGNSEVVELEISNKAKQGETYHLILELKDNKENPLTAYKRIIIKVN